jgi:hypothetical protein
MSIVYSRTFRLEGRRFLIPGIDLLNHHPTAHQAEWRLDDAAGCVHLVATAAITAGTNPPRTTSVTLFTHPCAPLEAPGASHSSCDLGSGGGTCLTNTTGVLAGEQVYATYGARGNDDFFLFYGTSRAALRSPPIDGITALFGKCACVAQFGGQCWCGEEGG